VALSSSLNVLHILETYPPDYGGGAAVTTREVCRALSERGHKVRALCAGHFEGEPYSIRTDYDGAVRIDRINLPYFKTKDPDGWQLGLKRWKEHEQRIGDLIDSLLDEWSPDIVDYHTSRPFGEEGLMVIARRGVPLISTLHEGWLVCPRLMLFRSPTSQPCEGPGPLRCLECLYSHYDGSRLQAMAKLPWRLVKMGALPAYRIRRRSAAMEVVQGAIARSEFMARIHRPHIGGNVRHISLGVDLRGLPEELPARPRNPLRFGFIAGFHQTKGINDLLDAAAALKRDGLKFELHVWGPGQEEGRSEITTRNLQDCVLLRGMYEAEERWQVYSEIDVAVMATTVCEPLGRVPMEAAAVGAPTIAPAIGGITESIRDEVDGLLYRFRDARDLERKMRRILEEPELVNKLIDNLPPLIDTREKVSEIEQFYFRVLNEVAEPAVTATL